MDMGVREEAAHNLEERQSTAKGRGRRESDRLRTCLHGTHLYTYILMRLHTRVLTRTRSCLTRKLRADYRASTRVRVCDYSHFS